jgi:hypothetical protein
MRALCSSILTFEAIVVLLAIPAAIVIEGTNPALTIGIGGLMVVAIFVLAGMQKRTWGLTAGWVTQVLILAIGFIIPMMFVLGAMFALLWYYAIRIGRRGEAIKAARQAAGSPVGSPT